MLPFSFALGTNTWDYTPNMYLSANTQVITRPCAGFVVDIEATQSLPFWLKTEYGLCLMRHLNLRKGEKRKWRACPGRVGESWHLYMALRAAQYSKTGSLGSACPVWYQAAVILGKLLWASSLPLSVWNESSCFSDCSAELGSPRQN